MVGKLAKSLPGLADDVAKILTHPSGIKDALSAWWRGQRVAPAKLSKIIQFDGKIDSALDLIRDVGLGKNKALLLDMGRKFRAKSNKLRQQMAQLVNNQTKFKNELSSHISDFKIHEQTRSIYEDRLAGLLTKTPDGKSFRLDKVAVQKHLDGLRGSGKLTNEARKQMVAAQKQIEDDFMQFIGANQRYAKSYRAAVDVQKKKKYVDKLIDGVGEFSQKLENEGVESGLKFIEDFEKTQLKAGTAPLLQELGYMSDFVSGLKKEIPEEIGEVLSAGLTSENLRVNKFFFKEWARMKATTPPEVFDRWAQNPQNALKIRELRISPNRKIRELAEQIYGSDIRSAASMAGRSPQEIADMLKLPAAALGVISASLGAFNALSWFSDSGINLIGNDAEDLSDKLQSLEVSARVQPLIDSAVSSLSTIQTGSVEIKKTFGSDPIASFNKHIPGISRALEDLSNVHNQWNTVIAGASDQNLASRVGLELGQFIISITKELDKLADAKKKAQER